MPWFVLPVIVVITVIIISILYPFAGLLITLAMIFEVIPAAFQPRVPFGGGSLRTPDLLILFLMLVVAFRHLFFRIRLKNELSLMLFPLAYLAFFFGVSLVYAKFFMHNQDWISEGRAAIFWLLLPLIVYTCNTPKTFRLFINGIIVIGLIIAVYVSIQSLFGVRIMTAARIEMLDATVNNDVTRSIAGGGIYLVMFSMYLILNRFAESRINWIYTFVSISILLLGIAVQFGRGVWIGGAIGLIVSSYVHRGMSGLLRTLIFSLIGLSLLLSTILVVKPRLAEALVDRATGISHEIKMGGSFNWRKLENKEAFRSIERHPLLGVGIGGDYKQTISSRGSFNTETTYIHSAYLYFPLKMGIFAGFIPLCFIVGFILVLRRGYLKQGKKADLGLVAALSGGFLVPVITSFTQPEWVSPQGIASLCVIMSLGLMASRYDSVGIRREASHE